MLCFDLMVGPSCWLGLLPFSGSKWSLFASFHARNCWYLRHCHLHKPHWQDLLHQRSWPSLGLMLQLPSKSPIDFTIRSPRFAVWLPWWSCQWRLPPWGRPHSAWSASCACSLVESAIFTSLARATVSASTDLRLLARSNFAWSMERSGMGPTSGWSWSTWRRNSRRESPCLSSSWAGSSGPPRRMECIWTYEACSSAESAGSAQWSPY